MSKDTYFTHFAKLSDTEELEIKVAYTLGGPNYFTGGRTPRGLKVRFTPVKRSTDEGASWIQYRVGDDRGRGFHVVDLARKSAKKGQHLADFVEKNIDELAKAATEQDWNGVASVLRTYA